MTGHHLNLGDTVHTQPVGTRGSITCELDNVGDVLGVKVVTLNGERQLSIVELTPEEAQSLGTVLLMYARAARQDGEVL